MIVKFDEITTRNEAVLLKGYKLYISRSVLPQAEEDQFYYSDLIGLDVLENENLQKRRVSLRGPGQCRAGQPPNRSRLAGEHAGGVRYPVQGR